MPRTRRALTTAATVAALTLGLAACGGDDGGSGGGTATSEPAGDADVALTGDDTLKYDITEATAEAGTVTFSLTNVGAVPHNVVIEETGDTMVVETAGGETAEGSIDLEAGTYTYYCDIPGHREAGMEGTLTVR